MDEVGWDGTGWEDVEGGELVKLDDEDYDY